MDVEDMGGWTALMDASLQGHADVVRLLLDAGQYTNTNIFPLFRY